jgi:predicted TIM-barrel fold metal-dependent hydrolase
MYTSDYQEIYPKRWLDEFTSGPYKPEVLEKFCIRMPTGL